MRIFVAVRPPQDEVDRLDDFLEVRRAAADLRWVDASRFHLTLAFLPDVPEDRYDDVVDALTGQAQRRMPFALRLAGGGAFPDPSQASVLWAGFDAAPEARDRLETLARGVRDASSHAGVRVDGQRFRPHLTVARSPRPVPMDNWVRLLEGYVGSPWPVRSFEVVQSHPGTGGGRSGRSGRQVRHEVLERVPLLGEFGV